MKKKWQDKLTPEVEQCVWEISVPPNIAVSVDKKAGAQFVVFPVDFTDGEHGKIVLIKLQSRQEKVWIPQKDVNKITLELNGYKN